MQAIIKNPGGHTDRRAGVPLLERDASLHQLGFLANTVRTRLHPEPVVTYVIDRNINYTDICVSACKFCAFFKAPEMEAARCCRSRNWHKK
jgi:2-iminoacetate synthase ThiH